MLDWYHRGNGGRRNRFTTADQQGGERKGWFCLNFNHWARGVLFHVAPTSVKSFEGTTTTTTLKVMPRLGFREMEIEIQMVRCTKRCGTTLRHQYQPRFRQTKDSKNNATCILNRNIETPKLWRCRSVYQSRALRCPLSSAILCQELQ